MAFMMSLEAKVILPNSMQEVGCPLKTTWSALELDPVELLGE